MSAVPAIAGLPFRARRSLVLPSAFPNGLLGWEGADYESSFVDGGAVSQLANQKDQSVWGSQATGTNQPTFRQNGINGKRAVQYATDDYLTPPAGSLSWFSGVSGYTWIAAVQFTSNTASQSVGPQWSTATVGSDRCGAWINASKHWELFGRRRDTDTEAGISSSIVLDTAAHVIHTTIDYAAAKARIWLDGLLLASSDTFLTTGVTDATASAVARMRANLLATPSAFGNVKVGLEGVWNLPKYDTDVAPMIRSLCQYYGSVYAGV